MPVLNETLVPQILGQLKSLTLLQVRMIPDRLINVLKMTTSLEELKFNSTDSNWNLEDNVYFLDTLSIKGANANPGEPSTFIAPRLRNIGLWVDGFCGELLPSYTSLILARRLEDPENAAYQGIEDFRVLLMLDKNRPDLIHVIAPLLVMRGSRGEKLVDVELVEVN
jgi:hypothetical protein